MPLTRRCVARIFRPGECMLTKVIITRSAPGSAGILVAEGQRGLVAVVAVGDQQLLVRHQLLDARRVGDLPEAVHGAVLVGDLGQRRGCGRLVEQRVDGAVGVGVQHEELAEVRVGVAQQLQAVLLGPGERLLVAVDDAGGVVLDAAERDEALAHQALAGIGHREFLEVGEHAGLGIARQHAGRDPVLQMAAARV